MVPRARTPRGYIDRDRNQSRHLAATFCREPCSLAKRSRQACGNRCSSSRNTPFVQPKPTTFMLYPALTCVSDERVTALYFSLIVPSRRKFSAIIERNL